MSAHDEQVQQRRTNLEELGKLGVEIYPRRFERTDTISALVAAHGAKSHDELEAAHIQTATSGRILAMRSFGKNSCTDGWNLKPRTLCSRISRFAIATPSAPRCGLTLANGATSAESRLAIAAADPWVNTWQRGLLPRR